MTEECETCRRITCTSCGFQGYRALTPDWTGPYRCPRCWQATGLTLTAVRHSSRGKHYEQLSTSRERHCPTCRCGDGSDLVPAGPIEDVTA